MAPGGSQLCGRAHRRASGVVSSGGEQNKMEVQHNCSLKIGRFSWAEQVACRGIFAGSLVVICGIPDGKVIFPDQITSKSSLMGQWACWALGFSKFGLRVL